jgi:hypothetical protein
MSPRLGRGVMVAFILGFVCVVAVSTRVTSATNYMSAGNQLTNGQCLYSDDSSHYLCYTNPYGISGYYGVEWNLAPEGCTLAWSSEYDACVSSGYGSHSNQSASAGSGGFLNMQTDGNLVLYNASSQYVWATFTNSCSSNCELALQDDGNLVLYYNYTSPLWSLFGDNS